MSRKPPVIWDTAGPTKIYWDYQDSARDNATTDSIPLREALRRMASALRNPDLELHVTSGNRSPAQSRKVGGSTNDLHTSHTAIDVQLWEKDKSGKFAFNPALQEKFFNLLVGARNVVFPKESNGAFRFQILLEPGHMHIGYLSKDEEDKRKHTHHLPMLDFSVYRTSYQGHMYNERHVHPLKSILRVSAKPPLKRR